MEALASLNVGVWENQGRLKYRAPPQVMTPAIQHRLSLCKNEVLDLFSTWEKRRHRFLQGIRVETGLGTGDEAVG